MALRYFLLLILFSILKSQTVKAQGKFYCNILINICDHNSYSKVDFRLSCKL